MVPKEMVPNLPGHGKLQVRSVSGQAVCCFEQDEVPNFTVSQLEEHVHSALSLSREEDVTLTLDSQILQASDNPCPWSKNATCAATEVQCIVQTPITFNFECGTSLCSDQPPVLIPMSRKVASRLRVGQLKGQAMKCIEQQRWTEICSLKLAGELLPDHQLLGDVLSLGNIDNVTLDLDLQRQTQRVYYYVAATPVRRVLGASGPLTPVPVPPPAPVVVQAPVPLPRPEVVHTALDGPVMQPVILTPVPVSPPAPVVVQAPVPLPRPEVVHTGLDGPVIQPVTKVYLAAHAERSAAAAASPEELQALIQHRLTMSLERR
jgi:hypothetical protein